MKTNGATARLVRAMETAVLTCATFVLTSIPALADSRDLTEDLTLGQTACRNNAIGVLADVDANGTFETLVVFRTLDGEAFPQNTSFGNGNRLYFFSFLSSQAQCEPDAAAGKFAVWFVDALASGFTASNPSTWVYKSVPGVQIVIGGDMCTLVEPHYRQVKAYTQRNQGGALAGSITSDAGGRQTAEFCHAEGIKEIYVRTDFCENYFLSFIIRATCTPVGNTRTWQGLMSSAWSEPGNWVEGVAPTAGNALVFPANATRLESVNDLPDGRTYRSLRFTGQGYTLTGSSGIVVNEGISAENPVSSVNTIALPLTFNVSQEIKVLNANARLAISGPVVNGGNCTVSGGGRCEISGRISGAGPLTQAGPGILMLAGPNTYAGATTISGGKLEVNNSSALGSTTGGTLVKAPGQLVLLPSAGTIAGESLTLQSSDPSSGLKTSGTVTWAGEVALSAVASDINVASGTLTISGAVIGTGGFEKLGTGVLAFTGTTENTYTGATIVNSGILRLGKSGVFAMNSTQLLIGQSIIVIGGLSPRVEYAAGNQLTVNTEITVYPLGMLDLHGFTDDVGAISLVGGKIITGAGTLQLRRNLSALGVVAGGLPQAASISGLVDLGLNTRTITTSGTSDSVDLDLAAAVSGTGGILKAGTGRLILSGNTVHTGQTTVSAGTLVANGSVNASAIFVNAGATLLGKGAVMQINAMADGTVIPGELRGVTTMGRRFQTVGATFGLGSKLRVVLDGPLPNSFSQLAASTANIGSGSILEVDAADSIRAGDTFLILQNAMGTFLNRPQNSIVTARTGARFRINYQGGTDNNDVVLTCIAGNPVRPANVTVTVSGGTITVCWDSIPGRTYRVERSTALGSPWTAVSGTITATGTRTCWSTPMTGTLASFYRIALMN